MEKTLHLCLLDTSVDLHTLLADLLLLHHHLRLDRLSTDPLGIKKQNNQDA